VDGIALIPVNLDCKYYHQIYENGTPIVMCNRYREDWKYDGVYVDNVALTRRTLKHMLDNGYTRIAFFTDSNLRESNKTFREEAFVEFTNQYCGINGRELIYNIEQSSELVQQSIQDFEQRFPNNRKAIFAINTNTLFITLREIKKLGQRIPEDIGICGYDLLGWAEMVPPGITTLQQPFYDLGVTAGRQIIKRINNHNVYAPDEIWLNGSINMRDSTKMF